jgi:hypothetical protein
MFNSKEVSIVLISTKEDFANKITDSLKDANLQLLYAEAKHEAIEPLERLMCELDIAIVALTRPDVDAGDLIRQFRQDPHNSITTVATSLPHPAPIVVGSIRALGVYAIVPRAKPPEGWSRTTEAVRG